MRRRDHNEIVRDKDRYIARLEQQNDALFARLVPQPTAPRELSDEEAEALVTRLDLVDPEQEADY